jgi:hypothetical protein
LNPLLSLLKAYLVSEFTVSPFNFKGVWIGNRFDLATWTAQTPALFIETGREYESRGFAQDQVWRNYTVTIHAVVSTQDSNLYRDPDTPYSIYNVSDSIREALAQNKSLGTMDDVFRYSCFQLGDVIEEGSPNHIDRYIRCVWRRAEQWDGELNNQPSLEPVTS